MIRDAARELPPVRKDRPGSLGPSFPYLAALAIRLLTRILVLLCLLRCWKRQRLSRVAEGTGPLKPQQPGATAKVLIPAQVGRDKILD
jgi:hypothetical protein